jgi:hypothetical protein
MKRRGGGSYPAMVSSACASFTGSPDCLPFCDFQHSTRGRGTRRSRRSRDLVDVAVAEARRNRRGTVEAAEDVQNWRSDKEPLRIQFAPGERWEYSGEGYSYLQLVGKM